MASNLESLLQAQYGGKVVDSGSFTLHRDKALEKIAKFQLPDSEAWILKVGQAAVLGGASELRIFQTRTEIIFEFAVHPSKETTLDQVFFDPSDHPVPFWQSLRSALWGLGLGQKRPFHMSMDKKEYFWTGLELKSSDDTSAYPGYCKLAVSHRTLEQGKGLPIVRSVQAARRNATLAKVIKARLFTCPMRVTLDSIVVDGFQWAPQHGYTSQDHPITMLWQRGKPALGIPPSTSAGVVDYKGSEKLLKLSQEFDPRPPEEACSAALLLSAHAFYNDGGDSGHWAIPERHSVVYWIKHGVVVERDELQQFWSSVSFALFINADRIRTDLTGLSLIESEKYAPLKTAFLGLTSELLSLEPDLTLIDRPKHKKRMKFAGASAVAGITLKFVFPPAMLLFAGGLVAGLVLTTGMSRVDSGLQKGYETLRKALEEQIREFESEGT